MNKNRLIVSAGLTLTGAAIALTLAFQSGKSFLLARPASAQVPVDFVEEEITRRVYFTNNDNYWEQKWTYEEMQQLYVYAWQWSDGDNHVTVEAVRMMEDVRQNENTVGGLYYADITFAGAGDEIGVIVLTNPDWRAQTVDVKLPSLWSSSPDVVYLNNGDTYGNRNASVGSISAMSDSQMSYFLSNYQTCSAAYNNGYNAYPQIMKDFCPTGKWYEGSTEVTDYDYDEYVDNGKKYEGLDQNGSTTISNKLEAMQELYESSGYSLEKYHVPFDFYDYSDPHVYTTSKTKSTNTIKYDSVDDNTYKNVHSSIFDVPGAARGIKFKVTNNGSASTQINVEIGTSGTPENAYVFTSHLVADDAYDYFDAPKKRAQYNIAPDGGVRECTFIFDRTEGVIDGILVHVDSCWAATTTTHLNGNITISEAVYLF